MPMPRSASFLVGSVLMHLYRGANPYMSSRKLSGNRNVMRFIISVELIIIIRPS